MISLIQRVTQAKVVINEKVFSEISRGYVILLGIFENDTEKDVDKLVHKVINLRIVQDKQDKMNLSIKDVNGQILIVSQFTLCADTTGGRRPSFISAKKPDEAEKLYELFVAKLKEQNINVQTGKFGEKMEIQIFNDGPVTIILDSNKF